MADLGLVGEIADSVVVMRDGVAREKGPVNAIFEAPQDAYTKALLACRPRVDVKPKRLPVIDDFMQGKPAGQKCNVCDGVRPRVEGADGQ